MTDDGRMRCIYCGRYFTQDRIDKHQGICGNLKNARPKGVDGVPTQTGAKVFNSAAARTGNGASAFMSVEQYKKEEAKRQQQMEREKKRKPKYNWRRQHEDFVEACRAGRGDGDIPSSPARRQDGKVPCPHCGRMFESNAAERHIPICANVKSRPKPPASPAASNRGSTPGAETRGGGHPPRPPSQSASPPPRPPSYRRELSGSPKPSKRTNENDRTGSESLPALGSTMRSSGSMSSGSMTSSAGFSQGTGLKAARSLKKLDSEALPAVPSSSPGRGKPSKSPGRRKEEKLDATMLPGSDGPEMVQMQSQIQMQQSRLDAQQRALMLRLLRQVPVETLSQELSDVGVSCADLDKEAMVKAMAQQLS